MRNWFKTSLRNGTLDGHLEVLSPELKWHFVNRWPLWARREQLPEQTSWTNWLLLGGRGAGKTRAGAEWVRAIATGDPYFGGYNIGRIALVGETYADAREVMVEGPSGVLAVHTHRERPEWTSSRRRLEWSNGTVAHVYSSEDPDALRGPQFGAAWCDAKTIWGSLIAVASALTTTMGMEIAPDEQELLTTSILQAVTVASSLFAVFGRLNANSVIQ